MYDYDSLMNGASVYSPVDTTIAEQPSQAAPAAPAPVQGRRATSQTIVLAWLLILALLVMAHVVTLSLQK